MRRELHVRFCEGGGVKLPSATRLILCFEYRQDAEKVMKALTQRFAKYGLTLHPEKTRLIEFGREALAKSEEGKGEKPATFDFLGFTHMCARSRRGNFTVHVRTMKKRLKRSLKAVSVWCRKHRHDRVETQCEALNRKLRGHYQYYGRPTNLQSLRRFYQVARKTWKKWLTRRTRGRTLTWPIYEKLLIRYPLLQPRITHPWTSLGSYV